MKPAALSSLVTETAQSLGFELVGIVLAGPSPDYQRFLGWLAAGYDGEMSYLAGRAVQRADPRRLLPEARSVIMLGANYFAGKLPAALQADPSRGLIASYAWGPDYHEALKRRLFQLDAAIRAATGRSTLGRAFVDSGPILERSWANRAGLGFIGKNTCLIAPQLGSWLFLAALLIPEQLEAIAHAEEGSAGQRGTCGQCTRCLDVCPTAAFREPYLLDARRCISYLTIEYRGAIPHDLRPLLGNWIFGCDLCQTVCPWNKRYAGRSGSPQSEFLLEAGEPELAQVAAPKLLELLALDDAGFRQRFRHSPVRRAKRRGLLRNVCIALGNWGDAEATPGLVNALNDGEPLIRGHAAWALGRIGTREARQALLNRAARELDASVAHEIALAFSLP